MLMLDSCALICLTACVVLCSWLSLANNSLTGTLPSNLLSLPNVRWVGSGCRSSALVPVVFTVDSCVCARLTVAWTCRGIFLMARYRRTWEPCPHWSTARSCLVVMRRLFSCRVPRCAQVPRRCWKLVHGHAASLTLRDDGLDVRDVAPCARSMWVALTLDCVRCRTSLQLAVCEGQPHLRHRPVDALRPSATCVRFERCLAPASRV
jgi:hypothetical protein